MIVWQTTRDIGAKFIWILRAGPCGNATSSSSERTLKTTPYRSAQANSMTAMGMYTYVIGCMPPNSPSGGGMHLRMTAC